MATETKYPDAILASTNLTGAVTAIDEDVDAPDANWLTATSATAATDLRVSFPSTSGVPTGAQDFKLWLRKTTGTPDPTADVMLYQNGTLRTTPVNDTVISNTTGQIVTASWDASDLSGTVDGSDVECRLVSTVGSAGTPGARPAFSAAAAATTDATLNGTKSVTVPTHSAGDILILGVQMRNTNLDAALNSIDTNGWLQFGGVGNSYGTSLCRVAGGWKVGNGSETAVSITLSGGTGTDRMIGRVFRFTAADGFHATSPVTAVTDHKTGATSTLTMPTVTGGTNRLGVAIVASQGAGGATEPTNETAPTNWTEPIADSSVTNGTLAIFVTPADSTASTGTGTAPAGWEAIGFAIVPGETTPSAVNTVEIGAIEWNVNYTPGGGPASAPSIMQSHARRRR